MKPGDENLGWNEVFAAWLIASAATLAALFLGEVMGLTPCVLCWYQRIAMFPLVLVLAAGLFPFDRRVLRYALPLAVAGWLLALWHWGIASGVLPERIAPCSQGVPCGVEQIVWLGFITLPMLSVIAFSAIISLLLLVHFKRPKP